MLTIPDEFLMSFRDITLKDWFEGEESFRMFLERTRN